MSANRVRNPSNLDRIRGGLFGWQSWRLPHGEQIDCWKARDVVTADTIPANWSYMAGQTIEGLDAHQVPRDGIASGTPMQAGSEVTRTVWWGGGYGKHEQIRAQVPRPLAGGRYWTTGYPVPWFDRRCIIAGPDGSVHELIQFDQDAPRREPGLPQQALGYGRWINGHLVEGRSITASDLPGSAYVWGVGSSDRPHQLGLVIDDYQGGKDGSLSSGPVCGAWHALDPMSASYQAMAELGGECAAIANALVVHGCRIIDRKMREKGEADTGPKAPHLLTQAGAWTAATNLDRFSMRLTDLHRVLDQPGAAP